MSNYIPPRLTLPDPRQYQIQGRILEYLVELNNSIQQMNTLIKKTIMTGTQTGTLIWDDGANYRITLVFQEGRLTSATTAASSGAAASWS